MTRPTPNTARTSSRARPASGGGSSPASAGAYLLISGLRMMCAAQSAAAHHQQVDERVAEPQCRRVLPVWRGV